MKKYTASSLFTDWDLEHPKGFGTVSLRIPNGYKYHDYEVTHGTPKRIIIWVKKSEKRNKMKEVL